MKNKRTGLIILIVAILIILAGVYIYRKNKAVDTPADTNATTATSTSDTNGSKTTTSKTAAQGNTTNIFGLKTYTNTDYHFSIALPVSWAVDPSNSKKDNVIFISPDLRQGKTFDLIFRPGDTARDSTVGDSLTIAKTTWNRTGATDKEGYAITYSTRHGGVIYDFVVHSQDEILLKQLLATFTFIAPGAKPTASTMRTFINSEYSFSLQYPATSSVQTTGYNSLHPFARMPIAFVALNDSAQTEGYLTINASSDSNDIARCNQPGSIYSLNSGTNVTSTSKITMNSLLFAVSNSSDMTGINGLRRNYSTLSKGICYDLELSSFPSACVNSGCENRKWSQQTETTLMNQLDIIAHSFTIL